MDTFSKDVSTVSTAEHATFPKSAASCPLTPRRTASAVTDEIVNIVIPRPLAISTVPTIDRTIGG